MKKLICLFTLSWCFVSLSALAATQLIHCGDGRLEWYRFQDYSSGSSFAHPGPDTVGQQYIGLVSETNPDGTPWFTRLYYYAVGQWEPDGLQFVEATNYWLYADQPASDITWSPWWNNPQPWLDFTVVGVGSPSFVLTWWSHDLVLQGWTSIDPMAGKNEIWLDWSYDSNGHLQPRITIGKKEPKKFNYWLSNGQRNPHYR